MFAILRKKAVLPLIRNVRYSGDMSTEQKMKTYSLMKKITLFVVPVVVTLGAVNAYNVEMDHRSHPRKEYIPYPYLNIMNRPWPWGDGKHSLFHNPKANWVKGVGYEEDWYC
ncbi:cytochrome c oxidase subunit 6A1, mitochondrial-like [Clavelina lepadiformis]|uniref:Cytochrome c oxidase polypeptide VIa n=1 Tax=Clavelina lepadiformis TaxID=159417 RepID=A0ABP0EWV4_CLALP